MKKNRLPVNLDKIDLNAIYQCPMLRTGTKYPNEIEDIIDVKIEIAKVGLGYDIIPLKEGYDKKFFYDYYIEWLFYEKYITNKD